MFVQTGEEFEHYVAKVFGLNGHHAEVTQASGDYGVYFPGPRDVIEAG